MQTSGKRSVFLRGKKSFLILGLALLVVGVSLIVVCSVIIKPDKVFAESVDLNPNWKEGAYTKEFHAEKGDWIEFDLTTSNRSILHLYGMGLGEIWTVDNDDLQAVLNGAVYNQSVQINVTTDYQTTLENMAAHEVYTPFSHYAVWDNNTFSGNFYLMRMPTYYPQILISGEALLAVSCGFLLVPIVPYFLDKARRLGINA